MVNGSELGFVTDLSIGGKIRYRGCVGLCRADLHAIDKHLVAGGSLLDDGYVIPGRVGGVPVVANVDDGGTARPYQELKLIVRNAKQREVSTVWTLLPKCTIRCTRIAVETHTEIHRPFVRICARVELPVIGVGCVDVIAGPVEQSRCAAEYGLCRIDLCVTVGGPCFAGLIGECC